MQKIKGVVIHVEVQRKIHKKVKSKFKKEGFSNMSELVRFLLREFISQKG